MSGGFQRQTWTPPEQDASEQTEIWSPEEVEAVLPREQVLLWLIVKSPAERRGTVVSVQPNQVFGRGQDSDIRWDDERVSRRHAQFTLEGMPTSTYFVSPLEARKPIEINGTPISGAMPLTENDTILMGDTLFVVKLLEV